MPLAKYTKNKRFSEWLKGVKFHNGYASNISQRVNKLSSKIYGMKSHDCHVFLQHLFSVAIHGYLTT